MEFENLGGLPPFVGLALVLLAAAGFVFFMWKNVWSSDKKAHMTQNMKEWEVKVDQKIDQIKAKVDEVSTKIDGK